MENEDIVYVLLNKPFHTFSYREKVSIKTTGRPLPKIQVTKPNGKTTAVNASGRPMRNTHGSLVLLQTIGYTASPVC